MRYFKLLILLQAMIILGCSSNNGYKILINKDSSTCLSEDSKVCSDYIREKCVNSYDLLREEHYNHLFGSNKYIVNFRCL